MSMPPDLVDKFRGALVGAAVGDAFGAPFEGTSLVSRIELERVAQDPAPLRYTDDTHMTLGMAQSLVDRHGFDGAHMAAAFARNFADEPWRGYGAGPPQVFHLLRQGVPWNQAGCALFNGNGSFGNGAAMRVAPASVLAFRNMEQVMSLARQTAVITHAHQLGIEGAVLQACALSLALQREAGDPINHGAFLDTLQAYVDTAAYREKLEQTRRLLVLGEHAGREEVVEQLGNGIEALNSVPTAIYSFLRWSRSFRDVVTYAISLGGDTDTIGSMAGALAGAYQGMQDIPKTWRDRVEGTERLQELADPLMLLALRSESPGCDHIADRAGG